MIRSSSISQALSLTRLWRRIGGTALRKQVPQSANEGESSAPPTSVWIPIEWNLDMQSGAVSLQIYEGPMTRFELKGRCKRCWGSIIGRADQERKVTGIRCLVCEFSLEGESARLEERRISDEAAFNAVNMEWGQIPSYGAAPFAFKVYPPSQGLTEDQIADKIALAKGRYPKSPRGKLTRHDLPPGSAGRLFIQAKLLVDGVGYYSEVQGDHVGEFPSFDSNSDGSVTVHLSTEGISENPKHREDEMSRNMGSLMGSAMMSAFACELALKAIAIATNDEAWREHDLLKLYNDLPEDSRRRLSADCSEIEDILADSKLTFGAWRYFESDVSSNALRTIVDASRARHLAKAARVILDEAMFVGLYGKVGLVAHRRTRVTEDMKAHDDNVRVTITGGERPRRA